MGEVLNGGDRKPLIPVLWPWRGQNGKLLRPYEILSTRTFSLAYISGIILIWYFLGFGHWLARYGGIWPDKMFTATHEYLLSFITSPFFHADPPHIFYVVTTFIVFCQSFEARAGSKETATLFFSTIAFTGLTIGLFMNVGNWLWPDTELFSSPMERVWIGGSVGFMGILGAMSHQSRVKWLVPSIIVLFEIWNRYGNGISGYITLGHFSSALFGFLAWGWYLSNTQKLDYIEYETSGPK